MFNSFRRTATNCFNMGKRGLAKTVNNNRLIVNSKVVQQLVANQFPQWRHLPVKAIEPGGWDNRTFRLGEQMLVRMPSAQSYVSQVDKEQRWLPILSPLLPLSIPSPLVHGNPGEGYPWKWSIYRWIEGTPSTAGGLINKEDFAIRLGQFLNALQKIDPTGGPAAGQQNFFRGGDLSVYDHETRSAIQKLEKKINPQYALEVWETAISSQWERMPVWIHGDIAPGNLLIEKDKLTAVIDFGQLAVGDPACDLAIAWTFLQEKGHKEFKSTLLYDEKTWARARGWALWKALISIEKLDDTNSNEAHQHFQAIESVIKDHYSSKRVIHLK